MLVSGSVKLHSFRFHSVQFCIVLSIFANGTMTTQLPPRRRWRATVVLRGSWRSVFVGDTWRTDLVD